MSYTGDGEVSAQLRPGGSVETLRVGATTARLVATGDLTAGRFGLFQWDMPAEAGGATPHFHRTFSESFYVVSGTVTIYDGRAWVPSRAGDFVYVPDGGIHGFRNDSGEAASMLILFAPGGPREAYFREIAENIATGRQPSPEERTTFLARHDQYAVDA
jgi:mannose-6-phosphate isomerase-like protein (cupin superfamily)